MPALVSGGRLVWDEFHRDARAELEVRLSSCHHSKCTDRNCVLMDYEKEEILVADAMESLLC